MWRWSKKDRGRWSGSGVVITLMAMFSVWAMSGGAGHAQARPPASLLAVTVEAGHLTRDILVGEQVGGVFQESTTEADSGRVLVTVAVTPLPQLTLYAVIGGASLDLDEFGFSSSLDGMYGGGGRVTLYDVPLPGGALFLDGRYLRFVSGDVVLVEMAPSVVVSAAEEITWNELRTRLGVSGRYFSLEPYGGIELSWVWGDDRFGAPASISFDIEQKQAIGLFAGLRWLLDPHERAAFFAEFNLIDEYGFRAGLIFSI